MAWTTPKTWSVGDVLTAADMNTYVRDNTGDLDTRMDYEEVVAFNTAVAATLDAGSTTETDIYSTLVAADVLGTGGVMPMLELIGRSNGAVASVTCTFKGYYGSTQIAQGSMTIPTSDNNDPFIVRLRLIGDGGVSAQRGYMDGHSVSGDLSSTAAETSSDAQTFKISATMATSGTTAVNISIDVARYVIYRGP